MFELERFLRGVCDFVDKWSKHLGDGLGEGLYEESWDSVVGGSGGEFYVA